MSRKASSVGVERTTKLAGAIFSGSTVGESESGGEFGSNQEYADDILQKGQGAAGGRIVGSKDCGDAIVGLCFSAVGDVATDIGERVS